ncbi:MAG: FAD-dependent oxidoreductase [Oscillospiraceae bacterium]|nr:FAD-dependent oxidoreductase [Oscillospiraceae bacterium]
MEIYDVLIIGGGPEGLSAGLYCGRAGLKALLLEGAAPGGQLLLADRIGNYPGLSGEPGGPELASRMLQMAQDAGVAVLTAQAEEFSLRGDTKEVRAGGQAFFGKTLILACGATPRKLNIPGEAALTGRGVSWCALCDGFFFRNKTVCVIGGGSSAVSEALYLAPLCQTVWLIHRGAALRAENALRRRMEEAPNLHFLPDTIVTEILGATEVTGVQLKSGEEADRVLPCQGVFVAIGRVPASEGVRHQLDTDAGGYLLTDGNMATSLPGVFAAGDIRHKPMRQVVTAAADGAVAAGSCEAYLRRGKVKFFTGS